MPTQEEISRLRRRILERIAVLARKKSRPLIPSVTLRKALHITYESDSVAYLVIPHYWALYIHDGTDDPLTTPTKTRGASAFIYFRNPRDDPRNRYPVRVSDWRPLTRAEYEDGLRKNRSRRKRGLPPYMYVFQSVRAPFPKPGVGFFDVRRGMRGLSTEVSGAVFKEFDRFARSRKVLIGDEAVAKVRL